MGLSDVVSRLAEAAGAAAIWMRRSRGRPEPTFGASPTIPPARPQGALPTLKMPTATGWPAGADAGRRARAQGQCVRDRPQAPALDPCAAERRSAGRRGADGDRHRQESSSTTRWSARCKRAAAVGDSANRITLLRDADGDGVAEIRERVPRRAEPAVRHGAARAIRSTSAIPMAWSPFPMRRAPPASRPGAQADRGSSPAAIGRAACCRAPTARSSTSGSARSPTSPTTAWRSKQGRAAIHELDLRAAASRIFAERPAQSRRHRLRAPTGALWTVVNERDGLGRRDAAGLSDRGARRRLLRLALLLLGTKR